MVPCEKCGKIVTRVQALGRCDSCLSEFKIGFRVPWYRRYTILSNIYDYFTSKK
jgi:hypothetical protein